MHSDDIAQERSAGVEALLVRNHRDFLAFLERRVGSRALAEDILQDAFVRALEKESTLRDREAIVPWFYRMLRNAIVDRHRRTASAQKTLAALAAEVRDEDASDEVRRAVCQCVKTLAQTLKPEYASAIMRIDVDGIAVKDYAEEAGITSGNAAVRVFRARDALRKQVRASCGSCATHGCMDCSCGAA